MAGGSFSNINLSNSDENAIEFSKHDQAVVSNVRIDSPGRSAVLVDGASDGNHVSNLIIRNAGASFSDTDDAIEVIAGDENVFENVSIRIGGFNGYRYAVNFDGGVDNKFIAGSVVDDGLTGLFSETVLWDNDFGPVLEEQWTFAGVLELTTGALRVPLLFDMDILEVQASVGIAPTGSTIIVDVNLNGATIFTTQADRPTIATATNSDKALPNTTVASADDYLTVDIDQIDSNAVGESLTVTVRMRRR